MAELWLLLLSTVTISLSGVMMPGPVFAVTVAHGRRSPWAGALVAIGHGLIEFPLIALVYWGLASVFEHEAVQVGIGLIGGAMLVWMGASMVRGVLRGRRSEASLVGDTSLDEPQENRPARSILAGLATSAANPYFFLWWATVGALLVSRSLAFGLGGLILVALTHWLCDLGWDTLVAWLTYRSRRLWTPAVHRVVFGLCGLTLTGFGGYFALSAVV